MKIMKHLQCSLESKDLDKLDKALKFQNYQKISSMNNRDDRFHEGRGDFIRKGIIGDWVNCFNNGILTTWDDFMSPKLQETEITDPMMQKLVRNQMQANQL